MIHVNPSYSLVTIGIKTLCALGMGFFALFSGGLAMAQEEVSNDQKETFKAEVLAIEAERQELIGGTSASATVQTITVRATDGTLAGERVTFENDLVPVESGDTVYVTYIVTINGDEYFYLQNIDRQEPLLWLVALFVSLLVLFAGWQGVRALISLSLSVAAILLVLVPGMLAGYDPVLISFGVAGLILALVLFGTHGFNPRSIIAFVGTWSAVLVTSVVAMVFVEAMRLTGFSADASVSLNFATEGQLDFTGLLLGGIIIGILGVLDDVSITQASVVQELKAANTQLSLWSLYERAIRVGRDHVGSLVNTLALAYVGVSLPLVLLFATSEAALSVTLNQEMIVAEIVRVIVGSIGLILAVPLTTIIAAWWFARQEEVVSEGGTACMHRHHH